MTRRGCHMRYNPYTRYAVCPTCGFVRRNWWARPLIHKGGKP